MKDDNKEYRVRIVADNNDEGPRSWSNLGVMVCAHRRYNLGDTQLDSERFNGWEDAIEHYRKEEDAVLILPLYLYDHSGITISTSPFSCPWDSGRVGFIYATRKAIIEECGGDAPEHIEMARQSLLAEVKTYDQFLTGDVTGSSWNPVKRLALIVGQPNRGSMRIRASGSTGATRRKTGCSNTSPRNFTTWQPTQRWNTDEYEERQEPPDQVPVLRGRLERAWLLRRG